MVFKAQGKTDATDSVPEYEKIYAKALKLIDSAKYKEAEPLLKKVLKENKEFYKAYTKLAFVYLKQNNFKEAEKSIKKSEAIMPADFETQKIKAINYYLSDKYKESKSAIDTAINLASSQKMDEDPELLYYRAQLMFKGKNYKQALETCDNALELKPKYLEVLLLRADIRFAKKEYNYSVKDLNDAIKQMPAEKPEYSAYKLRAKCKFEMKDFRGAVSDWNVYIDAIPQEEEALISRAAALINLNDNSKAIADLDEAIKLNKKNAVSYCYRGVAKGGNKSYTEGLKDLDESIKLKFDYGAAYVNRAALKMALKQKEEACKDLQKAESLGDDLAVKLIEQYCKKPN